MTRDDFSVIWHDWLRGLTLVGLGALMTGLYFLKWIPHDAFVLLMVAVALVVVLGFVLEHCICSLVPLWMRLVTLSLVLGSGFGLLLAVYVEMTPGFIVAQGKLSPSHPELNGYVPGIGDILLDVSTTPGLLASGDDKRIVARLNVAYRTQESPTALVEQTVKWSFSRVSDRPGGKGGGTGSTSLQTHFEGGVEGPFVVRLEDYQPQGALPLEVRASFALFPAWGLRIALVLLCVTTILVAPFHTRRGVFPSFVPGTLVLGSAGFAVLYGLPPASPEPKLLGVMVACAFGGALVGYLVARGVQRLFPSKTNPGTVPKSGNPPTSGT